MEAKKNKGALILAFAKAAGKVKGKGAKGTKGEEPSERHKLAKEVLSALRDGDEDRFAEAMADFVGSCGDE